MRLKLRGYIWILLIMVLLMIIAVGCSSESDSTKTAENDQKQETSKEEKKDNTDIKNEKEKKNASTMNTDFFKDLPEPPTTLKGILDYPTGKFSGEKFEANAEEIKKVLDKFPEPGEKINQKMVDKYWKKLVHMFAEDYPDPQNVVAKWGAYAFGSPDIKDPRYQFKENYNVEIILDSSGSMAAKQGSMTRMELAKEAIQDFVSELPEDANVGLRVYGFKGSGSEADKKLSCSSNKLVYGIKPYKKNKFKKALNSFSPAGWTPLADAIKFAKKDLSGLKSKNNTNIIYIVSDGIGTCGGNPVKQAKSLAGSNIKPIVNVIGFDVKNEGQKQLKAIAEAAKGTYTNVQNQAELQEEFARSAEIASKWRMWKANSMSEARSENVKRAQMMRDIRGKWSDKLMREYLNYDKALDYLDYELEKISADFASAVYDKREKRIDNLRRLKQQIWDNLGKIKSEDFEQAKKKIQKKYNLNTKNE
ncbi:VWA domain-containing protein [Virgibacillus siamensis]|uniref:VWA domain-containing protein n=1 Tax=Virgibacillus siamensis TaxID=480071 RepID=UPI0009861D76|nr:VWA domain-containing protein [Virgibacillus siamensis]